MRPRTAFALATLATTTLVTTSLLTGILGSAAGPDSLLGRAAGPEPASATELPSFGDCDELLDWYVAAALPHVGPWGLGSGWWGARLGGELLTGDGRGALEGFAAPAAGVSRDASTAVGNGGTGTNVQEAGVDEPDVAKTDGRVVAHLRGRRLVLTDASGPVPVLLGQLSLPREMTGAELLWVGDRLVLLSQEWGGWGGPWPIDALGATPEPSVLMTDRSVSPSFGSASTRALVVDVTDPGSPAVERDTSFGGSLVDVRQHGSVVRLVLSTTAPALDFVQPRPGRSAPEATQENRRIVRESSIEDWLPTAREAGTTAPLLDCSDVRHPVGGPDATGRGGADNEGPGGTTRTQAPWSGDTSWATTTVVSFDPADAPSRTATAVTTGSQLVYSSADRLYLAMVGTQGTDVHAFALDGLATDYVASGTVPGRVQDRWSMNEHDGHLRVATALGRDSWNPRENAVVVLAERGGSLIEVGRAGRMGLREQIQSVRWFGDMAVVVTFRQVDPLYTLDLSDPTAPEVTGELKIPGFSSYLHPVGGDLLLGLGQDASRRGFTRGAQASVFDLSDRGAPRRVATQTFSRHSEFAAARDPRSFTYLPERRLALATLDDWRTGSRLVTLSVGSDGTLDRTTADISLPRYGGTVRALPLDDGRVAVLTGERVRLLDLTR